MEIHVMPFSPSVYGSPCYAGFLLVYFHTDTEKKLGSLLRAFKKTSGKDTPVILRWRKDDSEREKEEKDTLLCFLIFSN